MGCPIVFSPVLEDIILIKSCEAIFDCFSGCDLISAEKEYAAG
jgi:hypothetical protein